MTTRSHVRLLAYQDLEGTSAGRRTTVCRPRSSVEDDSARNLLVISLGDLLWNFFYFIGQTRTTGCPCSLRDSLFAESSNVGSICEVVAAYRSLLVRIYHSLGSPRNKACRLCETTFVAIPPSGTVFPCLKYW